MKKEKFIKSIAMGIIGVSTLSSIPAIAKNNDKEKCYGVAKAGKNDCSSAKEGGHNCAGKSKIDGAEIDWIYVPKGLCDKLVNGDNGLF